MTTYIVANNNPIVGKVNENGKQEIKVYDSKTGNMRYMETDKDKVDEFVNNRNKKLKKQNKINILIGSAITIGSGIIGAVNGKKSSDNKFFGAIFGASVGLLGSILGGSFIKYKVDESITQKFIEENK